MCLINDLIFDLILFLAINFLETRLNLFINSSWLLQGHFIKSPANSNLWHLLPHAVLRCMLWYISSIYSFLTSQSFLLYITIIGWTFVVFPSVVHFVITIKLNSLTWGFGWDRSFSNSKSSLYCISAARKPVTAGIQAAFEKKQRQSQIGLVGTAPTPTPETARTAGGSDRPGATKAPGLSPAPRRTS